MEKFKNIIVLKPDSILQAEIIESEILTRGYKILDKYYICDYLSLCKKFRSFEKNKNLKMYNTMLIAANLESQMFGNSCVVFEIEKEEESLNEFLNKLFIFKKEVRKKHGFFSSNRACLAVNTENNYTEYSQGALSGELYVYDNNSLLKNESMHCHNGLWNFVTFSLIHIPGPDENEHTFVYENIKNFPMLKLSPDQWDFMKKYHTYYLP